jgi:hypothetical protein
MQASWGDWPIDRDLRSVIVVLFLEQLGWRPHADETVWQSGIVKQAPTLVVCRIV